MEWFNDNWTEVAWTVITSLGALMVAAYAAWKSWMARGRKARIRAAKVEKDLKDARTHLESKCSSLEQGIEKVAQRLNQLELKLQEISDTFVDSSSSSRTTMEETSSGLVDCKKFIKELQDDREKLARVLREVVVSLQSRRDEELMRSLSEFMGREKRIANIQKNG